MSIKKEKDGNFSMTCDICGDSYSGESYEEVRMSKRLYGWRGLQIDGKWKDLCSRCQKEIKRTRKKCKWKLYIDKEQKTWKQRKH